MPPLLRPISAGLSQIFWTEQPLCALILLLALALTAPVQLACCLAALLSAAAASVLLKLPRRTLDEGLYTVNPSLFGLALPLLLAGSRPDTLPLLLPLCAVGGLLALGFTLLLRRLLVPRGLSPLGLPFTLALWVVIPLARPLVPALQGTPAPQVVWSLPSLLTAAGNAIAQVPWIENVPRQLQAVALLLLLLLSMSPTDLLVALWSALLASAAGALLGLDGPSVLSGQLGFGAVLLSLFLYGRALPRTAGTLLLVSGLSLLNPILTALLRIPCAPLGLPTAALPWSILTLGAMALYPRQKSD